MSEGQGVPAEIPCLVAQAADVRPASPAIIGCSGQRVLSYAELHNAASVACERLRAVGVKRGDVAGLTLPASGEYLALLTALFRLGAVACPISPRWPKPAVEDAARRARCRWFVGPPGFDIAGARPLEISELIPADGAPEAPVATPLIRSHDPATFVFTSGSTGVPKIAVHSYANHRASALASNANLPLGPDDRWLLSLSLHHVAGLGVLFRCAAAGAAIVVGESIEDAILDAGVTHVSLVPAQLHRLIDTARGREALGRLKAILVGGGAVSEALIRRADTLALPIFTTYGLTEMCSQVTTTRPGDGLNRRLTSGKPIAPDTLDIGPGSEIRVRGAALFLGYLGEHGPERQVTEGGWFRTGDLGRFDDAGYLSVLGREDNMFICGGENIHPEEIERHIRRFPGVRAAVVVPLPDAIFGAIPIAFVAIEGDLDDAPLKAFLEAALPKHRVPRHLVPWPADIEPEDAKVNRRALTALALQLLS